MDGSRRGGRDLAEWVRAYDAQGWHRTGSRVDARSAVWLAREVSSIGGRSVAEHWDFLRPVIRRSSLRVGGRVLGGLPLFDGPLAPTPVEGRLGELASGAPIGVVFMTAPGGARALEQARQAADHHALVVVSDSADALVVRNAPAAEHPYGPVTMQIAGRHAPVLQAAVATRTTGVVDVEGSRRPSRAANVLAGGPQLPADPLVVVLTPRSGWWHAAAERGGGLACWLAALRDVMDRGLGDRVLFLATSGHELGYLGLRRFLDRHRPEWSDAVWVHLGANIGAVGGRLTVTASDPGLEQDLVERLAGLDPPGLARDGAPPMGEASVLASGHRRYVSLVGSNDRFHQRSDRYPDNVDPPTVSAVSAAISGVVAGLARDGARPLQ